MSEWRANGGGIKDSIKATRVQITSDRQSRIAALVRRAWAAQDQEQARSINDIGHWPVGIEESRHVTASVVFASEDRIPTECQSLAWLDSYLWDEVRLIHDDKLSARKLQETPASIEWNSPDAQQWVSYWLLARIN